MLRKSPTALRLVQEAADGTAPMDRDDGDGGVAGEDDTQRSSRGTRSSQRTRRSSQGLGSPSQRTRSQGTASQGPDTADVLPTEEQSSEGIGRVGSAVCL